MPSTPYNSNISLYANVPLVKGDGHTVNFSSAGNQLTWFTGFRVYNNSEYKYLDKNKDQIAVNVHFDDIRSCNYLSIFNQSPGRRYFAFIDSMEYHNDSTTIITFSVDPLQTFLFDGTTHLQSKLSECMIERSHVDRWNGVPGTWFPSINTMDEGVPLGFEYVNIKNNRYTSNYNNGPEDYATPAGYWYLIVTTQQLGGSAFGVQKDLVCGAPQPFYYYIFPQSLDDAGLNNNYYINNNRVYSARQIIGEIDYNRSGSYVITSSHIVSISLMAHCPIQSTWAAAAGEYRITMSATTNDPPTGSMYDVFLSPTNQGAGIRAPQIIRNMPTTPQNIGRYDFLSASGVKPPSAKNLPAEPVMFESKFYTYPYTYFLFTANAGSAAIIKMGNSYIVETNIRVEGGIENRSKVRYFITDNIHDAEATVNACFDNSPYNVGMVADVYQKWQQQNQTQKPLQYISSGVSLGMAFVGAASGLGALQAGAQLAGVASVANPVLGAGIGAVGHAARQYDMTQIPDTVKFMGDDLTFGLASEFKPGLVQMVCMQIPEEMKRVVGDHFTRYGYSLNRLDTPNIRSRTLFNYIKTYDCKLKNVNFEQKFASEIVQHFNSGVTFWHINNGAVIGDYKRDNTEVSMYG